jgi:cytochrome c553
MMPPAAMTIRGMARVLPMAALILPMLCGHVMGQARGDKAFGEYLSSECVTCHQVSGRAVGGIPPIVGWPEDQFLAVMEAYRKKERENNVMQVIAGKLRDDEIAALAVFFGSLKPRP